MKARIYGAGRSLSARGWQARAAEETHVLALRKRHGAAVDLSDAARPQRVCELAERHTVSQRLWPPAIGPNRRLLCELRDPGQNALLVGSRVASLVRPRHAHTERSESYSAPIHATVIARHRERPLDAIIQQVAASPCAAACATIVASIALITASTRSRHGVRLNRLNLLERNLGSVQSRYSPALLPLLAFGVKYRVLCEIR